MRYQYEYLKSLEGKKVRVFFADGCCADFLVLDTGHLEEGDDIAGELLTQVCQSSTHVHQEIGTVINFKAYDIDSIEELEIK